MVDFYELDQNLGKIIFTVFFLVCQTRSRKLCSSVGLEVCWEPSQSIEKKGREEWGLSRPSASTIVGAWAKWVKLFFTRQVSKTKATRNFDSSTTSKIYFSKFPKKKLDPKAGGGLTHFALAPMVVDVEGRGGYRSSWFFFPITGSQHISGPTAERDILDREKPISIIETGPKMEIDTLTIIILSIMGK